MREREHILETLYHFAIAGLLCTIAVLRIEAEEDVATGTILRRKLDEKGWEEVATVLFIEVPEVEIEIDHHCRPCITETCDVLDDRRARQ
jgi:hypothetical protein